MSVSEDSVAAISVGRTDCQARHGPAAWRCTAEPTPSPPSWRCKQNIGEVTSRLPESSDLSVNVECLLNRAHAQHMLASCSNIHADEVVDSLRAETLSIELSERGSNGTEPSRGFLQCGLFTNNKSTGFAVTLDVKMSSEATECGFDLVEQFWGDAVWARCSPHLSSTLTHLVAAEIKTSVSVRYCGLIQLYQSTRWAKSLAPSSSSLQRSASTNRVTGSMAEAKPHAERGHP